MQATALTARPRKVSFERERGVYAIEVTRGLAHVVAKVGAGPNHTERQMRVFRILADERIPIFLIKLHRTATSFALERTHLEHVQECLSGVVDECRCRQDVALLTIIASSMRDLTGVMLSISDSLQRAGARLYGVGDSHNSVQCLIDGARVEEAVAELTQTFGLEAADG